MPKVFRPSIKQAKTHVSNRNEVETQEIRPNQVFDSNPSKESSPCTITTEPRPSSPLPSQNPCEAPKTATQRLTDLDLDVHVNPERPQVSKEIVDLFVSKKPRKTKVKITEVLPPVDQPLDRASVTLRSLLHWVPTNKPPPT